METQEMKKEEVETTEVKKRGRPKKTFENFNELTTDELTQKLVLAQKQVEKLLSEREEFIKKDVKSDMPTIHSIDPQYQREILKQKIQTLKQKYEKRDEWEEVRGTKLIKMTQVYYEYPPGVHPDYPSGGKEKGSKCSLYVGRATSEQQRKKIRDL